MNPFLYKAHPLLYRLVDFLLHPGAHGLDELSELVLIFLAINFFWAPGLVWVARRAAGVGLSFIKGYALALPACLGYAPLMLTLLGDVIAHAFRWPDRYLLIFSLFVATQMLGGFYALAFRQGGQGGPVDLAAGMAVSLFLFLVSIPACLVLLGLNAVLRVV